MARRKMVPMGVGMPSTITPSFYSSLVDSWRNLRQMERQERRATCSRSGHQWVTVVEKGEVETWVICGRCLAMQV